MSDTKAQELLSRTLDRLWDVKYKADDAIHVFFGPSPERGAFAAVIPARRVWQNEPLHQKYRSIADGTWQPLRGTIRTVGVETALEDRLGTSEDFGPELLRLICWHHHRTWDRASLSESDIAKAEALANYALLTHLQYRNFGGSVPPLNLQLNLRSPMLGPVLFMMAAKIPIFSARYFVEVLPDCAFNAIRRSGHPEADAIISCLYELLFLQQKTGFALFDFLMLARSIREEKEDAVLVNHELHQVLRADALITYLKATLEKTLLLLGSTFSVQGLESKKNHSGRINAIRAALPQDCMDTLYAQLLFEMVDSKNFVEISNLRTGLIHKRGVAKLQPHSYAGVAPAELSDLELFKQFHEQHTKNSAAIIAVLAMLTDDLVRRDPPENAGMLQRELIDLMLAPDLPDEFEIWSPSQRTGAPYSYDPRPGVRRMRHTPR